MSNTIERGTINKLLKQNGLTICNWYRLVEYSNLTEDELAITPISELVETCDLVINNRNVEYKKQNKDILVVSGKAAFNMRGEYVGIGNPIKILGILENVGILPIINKGEVLCVIEREVEYKNVYDQYRDVPIFKPPISNTTGTFTKRQD